MSPAAVSAVNYCGEDIILLAADETTSYGFRSKIQYIDYCCTKYIDVVPVTRAKSGFAHTRSLQVTTPDLIIYLYD